MKTVFALLSLFFFYPAQTAAFDQKEKDSFVMEMVTEHGFEKNKLEALFEEARLLDKVLEAISRPAEKSKEWYEYRQIFLTDKRISEGVNFWHENRDLLQKAEQEYGVDRSVIVAIIGVETFYGRHKGAYRVIDSLATLGFNYPPRAKFFREQLKQFLLFTRRLDIDPLTLLGSYAGAMGMPQFIPSSFQSYAADFDQDGRIDIWDNRADVIGSVANYFKLHGWQKGQPVAVPVWLKKGANTRGLIAEYVEKGLKPGIELSDLTRDAVLLKRKVTGNPLSSLLRFRQPDSDEYWVAFQNFYTITRYNHSPLYAMAVYQLSEAIREAYISEGLKK